MPVGRLRGPAVAVFALAVALLGWLSTTTAVVGQPEPQSWLDSAQPANWNRVGMALPAAVGSIDNPFDQRFAESNRLPETPEDHAVVAAGWYLFAAYQAGWGVTIVTAGSTYDGMGRPLGFQAFVFVDGVFAGTLAPAPMDSRTDGALSTARLFSDQIFADYVRYRPSDALCCPSGNASATFRVERTAAGPLVVPVAASTEWRMTNSGSPGSTGTAEQLEGVSWQWQYSAFGNAAEFVPDRPDRYTLRFNADGGVNLRADCNVGNGVYTRSGAELHIEVLILTRAACPPGSLSQTFLQQLAEVVSYSFRDGNLILHFPFDSGAMRFRPAP